jgi:hypothetical protein
LLRLLPRATGRLTLALAALLPTLALAGNGRLLTTDAAEPIDRHVLGLQRSALALPWGLAVDTSLYADILLAPNLGLRWAATTGPHRFVVGARYTHFVGTSVYSDFVSGQEPAVTRFAPQLSGPSVYAAYGLSLGALLLQVEGRYAHYVSDYASVTGAAAYNLVGRWWLIGEVGTRFVGGAALRGAAGVRYGGESFGLALGASYAGLEDPMLPDGGVSVLPVFDLSWTFQ